MGKTEIGYHLQDRVTFDDLATYLKNNQPRAPGAQNTHSDIENEINHLR
jgi:hypothetical protein